jgi:hypothetical protein
MDAAAKTAKLEGYRARVDVGEELNATQLARYQGLEAWEARTAAGNITSPHIYLIIPLLFNKLTPLFLLYIYFLTSPAHIDPAPGLRYC